LQLFDSSQQGYISRDDLKAILHNAFNMTDVDVDELFTQIDSAKDDKICFGTWWFIAWCLCIDLLLYSLENKLLICTHSYFYSDALLVHFVCNMTRLRGNPFKHQNNDCKEAKSVSLENIIWVSYQLLIYLCVVKNDCSHFTDEFKKFSLERPEYAPLFLAYQESKKSNNNADSTNDPICSGDSETSGSTVIARNTNNSNADSVKGNGSVPSTPLTDPTPDHLKVE